MLSVTLLVSCQWDGVDVWSEGCKHVRVKSPKVYQDKTGGAPVFICCLRTSAHKVASGSFQGR
jgi:hypothetical protein